MNYEKKARLIGLIISKMRFMARNENKPFNEGDVFFSLCFKNENELKRIAQLCGI